MHKLKEDLKLRHGWEVRTEPREMAVLNPEKGRGYEWGKGLATTQARLVNPLMNCKG